MIPRRSLQRLGLLLAGLVFFFGYSVSAFTATVAAQPSSCSFTLYGRQACDGYLTNKNFYSGDSSNPVYENTILVNPTNPSALAIPFSVNSAATFEAMYANYLARGSTTSYDFDAFGAAITIDIMLGETGPALCKWYTSGARTTCTWQAAIAYAESNLSAWETMVSYYDSQGWIDWNYNLYEGVGFPDSGHACTSEKLCWAGTSSSREYPPNDPGGDAMDVAWSGNGDPSEIQSVRFYNPNTNASFVADRFCSNEVGTSGGLTPPTPPVATCDSYAATIAAPDPNQSFKLSASIRFTPGSAAAGQFGPDKMTVQLSGPTPYHTISQTTTSPVVAGGVATAPLNVPATNVSGTFTITWNVSGPLAPAKSCTDTINVAYQPFFDVIGGDVSAGQGFGNGCTANPAADIKGVNLDNGSSPGNYFGASTRQAAIATGSITNFATDETNDYAHNLSGSTDGITAHPPSVLAQSNASPSPPVYGGGVLGTYTGDWCVPNYVQSFSATAASTAHQLTAVPASWSSLLPNTNYALQLSGNQTIWSGSAGVPITIPSGTHVTVIDTTGSVYLKSDIKYSGYSNQPTLGQTLANIPQFNLLISGGNIFIDPNVDQLNGFYDAQPNGASTGDIFTCANGVTLGSELKGPGAFSACSVQPLTIYGAVAAGQIIFGRTGGNVEKSGPIKDTPAEQIVYTPELWLGSFNAPNTSCATDPTQSQCMYQSYTSLPPVL